MFLFVLLKVDTKLTKQYTTDNYFTMRSIIIVIFALFLLSSCNKLAENKEANHKTTTSKNLIPKTSAKLDSFKDFPEEVDGAGCYFSVTKKDFKKESYIFVSNYDSIAFIKMNGRFIKLHLIESKNYEPSLEQYTEKYKNDEFQVTVDFKQSNDDNGDEAAIFEGSVSVKHNNEPEVKKNLYGYCGC